MPAFLSGARMRSLVMLWLWCICSSAWAQHSSVYTVCQGNDCFYLGGTVHLLPPSQYPLPDPFIFAYQHSDTLVFETQLPASDDVAAQRAMLTAMQYPAGESLSQHLSSAIQSQLDHTLRKYELQLSMFDQYRAGFVATQLTLLETERVGLKGTGVDSYFESRAKREHKSLKYLESMQFQLNLLATLADGREAEFIEIALAELPQTGVELKRLLAAWRSGDLAQIERDVITPTAQQDPRSYQRLFVQRNQAWLPQLMAFFGNDQREFVLVGTGHLAGADGLIALLRAKGATVTQLETHND